jgi:hypothetical protein
MPYVHHISILHDVILSFEPELALGACVGFGAGFEQLIPADGFCPDEMLFEIGVNGSGGFDRASMNGNGLGAAFVFAGREK